MELATHLALTLAFSLAAMTLLWLLSLMLRNASIVDIWWGPGFAAIALVSHHLAGGGNTCSVAGTALPLPFSRLSGRQGSGKGSRCRDRGRVEGKR